ncbi:MAG TPA: anthranilate phosphoribosyltransferase [Thermodesulfobacteriaceae bacterium]|nr:anthranilate phosphoribosyltransferase [Thermodesulfobacteriaceae bacterium]
MKYKEENMREFGRVIGRLCRGEDLSREESLEYYRQVILDEQPELQQGAFLVAHLMKGPTVAELSGAWDALYQYDTEKIAPDIQEQCCDIVGTGSDVLKTVNVSTPAAFIASACGVRMAKKGARLVTGVSGATDILEIMGLNIEMPLSAANRCLEQYGICYLPGESFLKAGWGRLICSMRFTSVFNIIGPLTRPCESTSSIVIGAYAEHLCPLLIDVLRETGTTAAMSIYGMSDGHHRRQGIDEISVCGETSVVELCDGKVEYYTLRPEDFGVRCCTYEEIASKGSAEENVMAVLRVLSGRDEGPLADLYAVNAAAALRVHGVERDLKKGAFMAREKIADGSVLEKLRKLMECQGGETGTEKLEELLKHIDSR